MRLADVARYSVAEVQFAVAHFEEITAIATASSQDSVRDLREALRHEYLFLPLGRVCTCGPTTGDGSAAQAPGGTPRPSARTPEVLYLDLKRAYAALPMPWEGRTEAYLKMGLSGRFWRDDELYGWARVEGTIRETMPREKFVALHRRRLALETFALTGYQPRPQDRLPERATTWKWMARWLNGALAVTSEPAPAPALAA